MMNGSYLFFCSASSSQLETCCLMKMLDVKKSHLILLHFSLSLSAVADVTGYEVEGLGDLIQLSCMLGDDGHAST